MKPEHQDTIERFLEDTLNETELHAFQRDLEANVELQQAFAHAVHSHGLIREAHHEDADGIELEVRVDVGIGATGPEQFSTELLDKLDESAPQSSNHLTRVLKFTIPLWVAAILLIALLYQAFPNSGTAIAEIESTPTGMSVLRNGQQQLLEKDDTIQDGDVLRVPETGELIFRMDDNSLVRLEAGSTAQIGDSTEFGTQIFLANGLLTATVTPRKSNQPFVVSSKQATATVIGTTFAVEAKESHTRLDVTKGAVQFSRVNADPLMIEAGMAAISRENGDFSAFTPAIGTVMELPKPQKTQQWHQDRRTAEVRFTDPTNGEAFDPTDWVRQMQKAGIQRILLKANSPSKFVSETARACEAADLRFGISYQITDFKLAPRQITELLAAVPNVNEFRLHAPIKDKRSKAILDLVRDKAPDCLVSGNLDGVDLLVSQHAHNPNLGQPAGQYVRITIPSERAILMLAEIEVMADDRNVAYRAAVQQSSTDYGGDAERAVDGNKSGAYFIDQSVTHTEYGSNPWWEVDLGRVRIIDALHLWNRTDAHRGRFENYQVEVLDPQREAVWTGWLHTNGARSGTLDFTSAPRQWQQITQSLPASTTADHRGTIQFELNSAGVLPPAQTQLLASLAVGRHQISESRQHMARTNATATSQMAERPAKAMLDNDPETYWQALDWTPQAAVTLYFPSEKSFNTVVIDEPVHAIGRTTAVAIDVWDALQQDWNEQATAGVINGQRIIPLSQTVSANRMRLRVLNARIAPIISEITVMKAETEPQ